MKTSRFPFPAGALALAVAGVLAAASALAQNSGISVESVPADMVEVDPGAARPVDLGQSDFGRTAAIAPTGPGAPAGAGTAMQAARAAQVAARPTQTRTRRPPPSAAERSAGVERAVFDRAPITVPLPIGKERLITLPAPAALHVPNDMAQVARIEAIDRTLYVTALVPFTPLRIVAELIDSGQQIPLDLVADAKTAGATAELQISTVEAVATPGSAGAGGAAAAGSTEATAEAPAAEAKAPDMVDLTRHAARQLYAPSRLAWATTGVQQMDVAHEPVEGLIPGLNVTAEPLGQWRGGKLYVTAVRVTNRSPRAVELPLENFRGKWLAATAQHGRIGPAGSETDTTAVYLICDREFSACLH